MAQAARVNKKSKISGAYVTDEMKSLVDIYSGRTGKTISQIINEALLAYKPIIINYLEGDRNYENGSNGNAFELGEETRGIRE